jgi:hypothetical protein
LLPRPPDEARRPHRGEPAGHPALRRAEGERPVEIPLGGGLDVARLEGDLEIVDPDEVDEEVRPRQLRQQAVEVDQVVDAREGRARQVAHPRPGLARNLVEPRLDPLYPGLLLVEIEVRGRAAPEDVHDAAGIGRRLVRPEPEAVGPEAGPPGHARRGGVARREVDPEPGRPHVVARRRRVPDAQDALRRREQEQAHEDNVGDGPEPGGHRAAHTSGARNGTSARAATRLPRGVQ